MKITEIGVADNSCNQSPLWGWPKLVIAIQDTRFNIRQFMGIPRMVQSILQPLRTPLELCIKLVHSDVADTLPELSTSMLHRVPSGDLITNRPGEISTSLNRLWF